VKNLEDNPWLIRGGAGNQTGVINHVLREVQLKYGGVPNGPLVIG